MGVIATAVNYVIYLLGICFLSPAVAMLIACVVATIVNYFMTTGFTFKVERNRRNALGFVATNLINMGLNEAFLYLFIWIGVNEKVAPVPMYAICVPVNYLLVRHVMRNK